MPPQNETPFTARMRQICDEASERCPGYYPRRFLQMIENCEGDFLSRAKSMILSPNIQHGLWILAKHDALDISMEAVVLQKQWRDDFTTDELKAAAWRKDEAKRRIVEGVPADSSDW